MKEHIWNYNKYTKQKSAEKYSPLVLMILSIACCYSRGMLNWNGSLTDLKEFLEMLSTSVENNTIK